MDRSVILAEVRSWPREDRLRLIEEVWDGLADERDEPEISEGSKAELDRRLARLDRNPDAVVPWEVVEARAIERLRRRPDRT